MRVLAAALIATSALLVVISASALAFAVAHGC